MRRPNLWLALAVALSTSLLNVATARAAACPVTLDWFWIGATGSKQSYVRYNAQVSTAPSARYTIRFSVLGSPNDMKHTIQAVVDSDSPHWALLTFPWPTASLRSLAIKEVALADGTKIQCTDAAAVSVLKSTEEVKLTFDDSDASWPAEVLASLVPRTSITDAKAIRIVAPDYPMSDRNALHQGAVTVEVTVGPDGHPVAVAIGTSSGYPGLDKAALAAAQINRYEPATVGGTPIVAKYFAVYHFTL